jgi:hypothetical protein
VSANILRNECPWQVFFWGKKSGILYIGRNFFKK